MKIGIFLILDEPLPQSFSPQCIGNQLTLLTGIARFGQFPFTWVLCIMGAMFKAAFETPAIYWGFHPPLD